MTILCIQSIHLIYVVNMWSVLNKIWISESDLNTV